MHLEVWQINVVAGCKTRKDIEIQPCILDSMMNRLDVYDEDCVSGLLGGQSGDVLLESRSRDSFCHQVQRTWRPAMKRGVMWDDTLWVLDLVTFNDSINRRLALQCANAACKVGLDERGSKLSFQREASNIAANIPTFQPTSTVERIS